MHGTLRSVTSKEIISSDFVVVIVIFSLSSVQTILRFEIERKWGNVLRFCTSIFLWLTVIIIIIIFVIFVIFIYTIISIPPSSVTRSFLKGKTIRVVTTYHVQC